MTTWYVRPDSTHGTDLDGKSYEKAWGGWPSITWGASGFKAGDTLYVCGAHASATPLSVGSHGATADNRATIRGDYAPDPGSMVFSGSSWLLVNKNYTTIKSLTITAGTAYCIYLYGLPNIGATIQGCVFHSDAPRQIINLHGADNLAYVDLTIDGNDFNGAVGTGVGAAIHWLAVGLLTPRYLTRITVSNNTFTNCSSNRAVVDFRISDDTPDTCRLDDIVISGNTFTDCNGVAVEAFAATTGRNAGIRVADNVMTNMSNLSGGMGGAFSIGGFTQSATSGFGPNIIARNRAYGLAGPSGFANIFYGSYNVFDNYAEDLSTDTIDGCGVLFDHGAINCSAYSNQFKRLTGTGIAGNISAGFGILVLDATDCRVYSNLIVDCVVGLAFGTKLAGQSSDIFNNTFINCSERGVRMVGNADAVNNLARNNIFTTTDSTKPSCAVEAPLTGTWTGESYNCFHSFGATSGHTLASSTVTIDPDLDDDYRPRAPYVKVAGTYLGETDFYGNAFSDPAPIGAVNDEAVIALSDPQQDELQKAVTRAVYFVQLEFASSTQYVCTANITLTWGGHDWLGFGLVGGISPIEESEGVESRALTFTLNVAQSSVLSLAVGSVEEYRGKVAKMYFCPLDESFQLIGTPQLCWRGIMDLMAVGVEGEEGKITLKCETSAYGLKRQPSLRLNAAQHKKKYPADTGFDYLTDLIANPQVWLSKRFQRSVN